MNLKSNFWIYLKRTLILIGLIFLVLIVQLPVQLMALKKTSVSSLISLGVLYFVGFGIAIYLAWKAYQSVWQQKDKEFVLNKNDCKLILKSLLLFYVVEIVLQFLNMFIFKQLGTENNNAIFMLLKSNPVVLILMSISMIFLSPVLEELVFRGYLIRGLFANTSSYFAIFFSGILFSCGHMSSNIVSFAIYACLGMILAHVYIKTDKIQVSIGIHFLNNLIATILMLTTIL